MKRLQLLICCLSFLNFNMLLKGQEWTLSSIIKASIIDPQYSILDNQNNLFILAAFNDTIYSPYFTKAYSPHKDLVIFKFNSSGNVIWYKRIGSSSLDAAGGLAIDINNNCFITGTFYNNCRFTSTDSLIHTGNGDIFLAKYNSDGVFQWAKRVGSSSTLQSSMDLKFDGSNNLLMAGFYKDSLIIGSTLEDKAILLGNAFTSTFIAQFDLNGKHIWSKRFLSTSNLTRIRKINPGPNEIYLGGYFQGNLSFDIDTISSFIPATYDAFIYKTDLNGNGIWVRRIRGSGTENFKSIALDENNNIYFLGNYNSTAIYIDSTESIIKTINGNVGGYDTFIGKYNSNGLLQWFIRKGSTAKDIYNDFTVKNNIIYATGYFANQMVFNQDTLRTSNPLNEDPFLAAFNENGDIFGAISIQGTGNYNDAGYTVNIDASSRAVVTGYYRSRQIQIGSQTYTSSNVNKSDLFYAVYSHPLVAVVKDFWDASCYGVADGMIEVLPYFGRPPYTYLWSHDPLLHQAKAENLHAGNYSVIITDANGEHTTVNKTITQPQKIRISGIISPISCHDGSNGGVNITVTQGNAPYSYSWSTGYTGEDLTNAGEGVYTLTVTDANGCPEDTSFTLTEPPLLGVDIDPLEVILCHGQDNASAIANATGGTGSYSYLWDDPEAQTTKTAVGLAAGSYTVTVTDANGCFQPASIMIDEPDTLAVTAELTDPVCAGDEDGSVIPTVTGGKPGYEYLWSNGVYQRFNTSLPAGTYTLTVNDYNGCTIVKDFMLTAPDSVEVTAELTGPTCSGDPDGAITLTATGGSGTYEYSHDGGQNYTSDPQFTSLLQGDYVLMAKDNNDCLSAEVSVSLIKAEDCELIIYDAFSPDNNGMNDEWYIGNIDIYPNCRVMIFNLWGIKVFSSDGYGTPWNGTYNGNALPAGTYYYTIDPGNGSAALSGAVSIVK
jgi:gliding motility-associated-like protein